MIRTIPLNSGRVPRRTSLPSGAGVVLEVISLARYRPVLNPKERESATLKRNHRSHLAPRVRVRVDELAAGLRRLGGEHCAIADAVPQ